MAGIKSTVNCLCILLYIIDLLICFGGFQLAKYMRELECIDYTPMWCTLKKHKGWCNQPWLPQLQFKITILYDRSIWEMSVIASQEVTFR